jgi:voltage-gated potassium channel
VIIFTLEYLMRLWTAENRWRFVFSFYGLVDLLAILPFYVSSALDLRGVRVLRLLRLFRILKLARYNRAMHRFARAFSLAREELVVFFAATVLVLYASAVGIYHFEKDAQPEAFASVFHALWWAVETLTTVGYGDTYPITLGGRIFTFFMVMCGLGIVGMPAGIMAAALNRAAKEEER